MAANGAVVAGVAWAQHVGIERVEVRVDEGPWREAELAAQDTIDTWRQWRFAWDDATPGNHTLQVRATDAGGSTQTADGSRRSRTAPPANTRSWSRSPDRFGFGLAGGRR